MKKHLYFEPDEIRDVEITWSEDGYKRITVTLNSGESFTLESDS